MVCQLHRQGLEQAAKNLPSGRRLLYVLQGALEEPALHRHEKHKAAADTVYSFGRSWARDQNDAARKHHWQIFPHLVLWAVIAAVMVPPLLRL